VTAIVLLALFAVQDPAKTMADEKPAVVAEPAVEKVSEDHRRLMQKYCWSCHSATQAEASLDLQQDDSVESIIRHHTTWQIVIERLKAGEMPPADAEQPTAEERTQMVSWLESLFQKEADRNSDDPGVVLARRLSHAEFDNSVRDLTGADIRPTREFPVDPANEAGFDNSAESLTMSPALFLKYVAATRSVADHLVLTPRGFLFAPFPCVTETDRDKFCVQRIVDFYRRHEVHYDRYFYTLWKYSRLADAEQTPERLTDLAEDDELSPMYLATLNLALKSPESKGPLAEIQTFWKSSIATAASESDAQLACRKMDLLLREIREDLSDPIPRVSIKGVSAGSQPLIDWWNEQQANARRSFPGDGDDAELDEARRRFCQIFPDKFFVASRGHYSNADLGADVRLLSAGYHLMQGYCRDDRPLQELVLSDADRQQLDQLWDDLEYVTQAPLRQYKDFLFFERAEPPQFAAGPEFDFARPENKDVTTSESIQRMRTMYLEKALEQQASDEGQRAIESYFDSMNRRIRWIEDMQKSAESAHLEELQRFAARAWRQPLNNASEEDLIGFYRSLRDKEQLSHEDAMRDCVASVLLSPRFCYRADLGAMPDAGGKQLSDADQALKSPPSRALTDYELASRLSYFLWASLPDNELLQVASTGELSDPPVLRAQVDRMLNDPKVRGLATEFLANWLEIRRFEEHNAVDRERFPAFDDDLRSAMFEEPIRFFTDLIQRDGSVDELIAAEHTFVNQSLAEHYGVPWKSELPNQSPKQSTSEWQRVDSVNSVGRGGLLPMSVFLTKNSPGLRTSPVKRGYWVVRRLLGEHIPAPPPNVPELPKDESELGELSLSQLLARHRDNVACASCHDRFDAIGLIFEAYGPVGEHRTLDLAGHPVQTEAAFPNGQAGRTLDDLRSYILTERRNDFELNFVRKMLSYALGRSLQLSDTATVQSVREQMVSNHRSIRAAIHGIVASPQFLRKRDCMGSREEPI
jgi:mono/diheme cytochrome c family protein